MSKIPKFCSNCGEGIPIGIDESDLCFKCQKEKHEQYPLGGTTIEACDME